MVRQAAFLEFPDEEGGLTFSFGLYEDEVKRVPQGSDLRFLNEALTCGAVTGGTAVVDPDSWKVDAL